MAGVQSGLLAKHAAREQALALCSEAIRHSANAIRAVHRNEYAANDALVAVAREKLAEVSLLLADHPDIYLRRFCCRRAERIRRGLG